MCVPRGEPASDEGGESRSSGGGWSSAPSRNDSTRLEITSARSASDANFADFVDWPATGLPARTTLAGPAASGAAMLAPFSSFARQLVTGASSDSVCEARSVSMSAERRSRSSPTTSYPWQREAISFMAGIVPQREGC